MPETVETLLARIDERTAHLVGTVADIKLEQIRVRAELVQVLLAYVTKVEFWPVRSIVYTGAGIVLIAVLGALVYLVVGKH